MPDDAAEPKVAIPPGEGPGYGLLGPRTRHLMALEFGNRAQFDDPRLEWRRLFSELLGTFFLLLAAAGGGLLHAEGQISLAAAVVAPGLTVMGIILYMGAVSGAHLNPAVTLAFALRGDFPWKRVPGYIVIQLIGATLACLFLLAVFGNVQHLGATLPGPGYVNWQALLMEIVLTLGLVSVILGTASAAQNVGPIAALGVGGYIALAGLWAAPVSGVSMNPARSFGPALVSGYWTSYWVYSSAPSWARCSPSAAPTSCVGAAGTRSPMPPDPATSTRAHWPPSSACRQRSTAAKSRRPASPTRTRATGDPDGARPPADESGRPPTGGTARALKPAVMGMH